VVLTSLTRTARSAVAVGTFAVSLVVLFGVSAAYHRVTWSLAARQWMRRLDHAAIFVLIAGTYTPMVMLALPSEVGSRLLLVVWTATFVGILQSLLWVSAPKVVSAGLAVAVGWTIVPWLARLTHLLGGRMLGALVAGGLFYTLGAIVYAARVRTPWPDIFGYHEVFHALTVLGAAIHFAAVAQLVWGLRTLALPIS
jgi:hemolysin III